MQSLRSTLMLLPALSLLGACGGGIDGIWMLYIPATDVGESECEETLTHNFSNGYTLEEEDDDFSPWTSESESTQSDGLNFVQIVQSGGKEAVLISGSDAYPGTKEAGVWVFEWEGSEDTTNDMTHELGYAYAEDSNSSSTYTLSLTLKGGNATGSITSASSSVADYTESDRWGEQTAPVVESVGQIPSEMYLVYDGFDFDKKTGEQTPFTARQLQNTRDSYECTADPCELSVSSSCSSDSDVTGTRTGFADDDAYDYMSSVNQRSGT